MSAEENIALVKRFAEKGWRAEDTDAMVNEFWAPNLMIQSPPLQFKSSTEFKQHVTTARAAFPDLAFTLEEAMAEGDRVAYRWTFRGTHQGEFMGVTGTGKQIVVTGAGFARIADGKLVELRENFDALGMMQQIGAIPTE